MHRIADEHRLLGLRMHFIHAQLNNIVFLPFVFSVCTMHGITVFIKVEMAQKR